ncbi:protein of unknown function [Nitrospira defluvii]|uniref:Uncharacterized protein n=1 Tax=Nitrospira defluvii TaxID=330214 RepID=D8P7H3_9BACT|nr:protein of unknown function [Nitrospira defluvii]
MLPDRFCDTIPHRHDASHPYRAGHLAIVRVCRQSVRHTSLPDQLQADSLCGASHRRTIAERGWRRLTFGDDPGGWRRGDTEVR